MSSRAPSEGVKAGTTLRVANQPGTGAGDQFSELLRLQSEFHGRLTEETLRYLRRLQGAYAPAAPGTVVVPASAGELRATAPPGGSFDLAVEIENRQRVHCMVTPTLAPLVGASGITWFPEAEMAPPQSLLAPDEVARLSVKVALPANLPLGAYRGALILQGFGDGALALTVEVIRGANGANATGVARKPARHTVRSKKQKSGRATPRRRGKSGR